VREGEETHPPINRVLPLKREENIRNPSASLVPFEKKGTVERFVGLSNERRFV